MFAKTTMVLGLTLFLSATALAAGGGGGGGSSQPSEYRKAVKAIKKEDYSKAVELLQKVVDKKPKNANA